MRNLLANCLHCACKTGNTGCLDCKHYVLIANVDVSLANLDVCNQDTLLLNKDFNKDFNKATGPKAGRLSLEENFGKTDHQECI